MPSEPIALQIEIMDLININQLENKKTIHELPSKIQFFIT